ncbi:MAG: TIGR02147 family protein [Chitinispirillaceae bacterium]|nr:TIGR02147 family protein [Chitinispirillaceae bacterium]
MKSFNERISIFNYFDYREYLEDCFNALKSHRRGYSFREFSRQAGLRSHNFLPRILSRQRNLSEEFIPVLSAYLHLPDKERKYFTALVSFNNAKRPSIKEAHLKRLLALRVVDDGCKLEDKKLHFFDKWYYPVIRELASICDFKDDYTVLARHCIPRISPVQARGAVKFLLENGFLKRGADGRYSVVDAVIATAAEVDSAIIPKYHKKTLQQCAAAVETVGKEDRNFSSSTLLVSRKLYKEIKEEIYQFRKRLLAMAKNCKDPEMVCFTGFQLLPRSKIFAPDPGKDRQ